ncbi:hypothetical protein [Corynebacterium sp.]|uniref:hypothetical protein n=1 Tax=Corynebacterium sp. TaxID=1720 RepID=UPI002A908BE8|nr:hypothetical protein [Corynebacterium sp.]MDY5785344.1 hypothetical protein [Corynebacterium sp.]
MTSKYNGGNDIPRDGDADRDNPWNTEGNTEGTDAYGAGSYGSGDYTSANHPAPEYGGDAYSGENYGGYYSADAFDVNGNHGALRHHGTTIVDGTYGDGVELHPFNDPATNGWIHRRGTGKLDVMAAWAFGFKATFANWKIWLPLGFITTVGVFLLAMVAPVVGDLAAFALLFLYPVIYSFALMSTLAKHWRFDGLRAPKYGLTLGVMITVSVIVSLVTFAMFMLLFPIFGQDLASMASLATVGEPTEEDWMLLSEIGWAFAKIFAVMLVGSFLISPFTVFPQFYAADSAAGFGGSLRAGVAAGARNYPQLLLFGLVGFVVAILGVLALGLGLIIVMPAAHLALAHAYRQVSGGPVPYSE